MKRLFLSVLIGTFLSSCIQFQGGPLEIDVFSTAAKDIRITAEKNLPVNFFVTAEGLPTFEEVLFEVESPPTKGNLELVHGNRGSFELRYVPQLNALGEDFFLFHFRVGERATNIAKVTINISNRNTAPVATDINLMTDEDTAKTFDLSAAGSDLDGDTLVFDIVTPPQHGSISGVSPNFIYTPNANYHGPDSFTFQTRDASALSNVATANIQVRAINDLPVATPAELNTDEDTPKRIPFAGTDADGDTLRFDVVSGPQNGTITGVAPNRFYAPNPNFHGTDTIVFVAKDATSTSPSANITITVNAVNDPPVIEDLNIIAIQGEDTPINLSAMDPDSTNITFTHSDPSHGELTGTGNSLTYTSDESYFGDDAFTYQASDGTDTSASKTVRIQVKAKDRPPSDYSAVLSVAAGDNFSCALFGNGSVKCWGDNSVYQLATGGFRKGDEPNEMGLNLQSVPLGKLAKRLSLGTSQACAILEDDSLKCWGYLYLLNPGSELDVRSVNLGNGRKAMDVAVGNENTCAILDNGAIKCWGRRGKITGDNDDRKYSESVPAKTFGGVRPVQLSAGNNFMCALMDNAKVSCWGENTDGQLGLGHTLGVNGPAINYVNLGSSRTAKRISSRNGTTCAILNDDSLKCWGGRGENLGVGATEIVGDNSTDMGDNLKAVDFGANRTVKEVAVGYEHVCAILDNDRLRCWGKGGAALGLGHNGDRGGFLDVTVKFTADVELGADIVPIRLSTGYHHNCLVFDNERAKCFGKNDLGQLGLGDNVNRGDKDDQMGDNLPFLQLIETNP